MTARFDRAWAKASRANLAASVGFLLTLSASQSASATLARPAQPKARTADVCRRCAGEIPNPWVITRCLRRQKASVSEACRAVFEQ